MSMAECNCQVCQDTQRWMTALNPQSDEAKAVFDEIMGRLEAAETDVTYYRMKLAGTWDKHTEALTEIAKQTQELNKRRS